MGIRGRGTPTACPRCCHIAERAARWPSKKTLLAFFPTMDESKGDRGNGLTSSVSAIFGDGEVEEETMTLFRDGVVAAFGFSADEDVVSALEMVFWPWQANDSERIGCSDADNE